MLTFANLRISFVSSSTVPASPHDGGCAASCPHHRGLTDLRGRAVQGEAAVRNTGTGPNLATAGDICRDLPDTSQHSTLNMRASLLVRPTPGLGFAFLGLSLCFGIKSLMLFKLVALKYYLKGKKGGYIFSRLKENIHSCSRQRTVPRAEDKIKSSGNRRIQTDLAA